MEENRKMTSTPNLIYNSGEEERAEKKESTIPFSEYSGKSDSERCSVSLNVSPLSCMLQSSEGSLRSNVFSDSEGERASGAHSLLNSATEDKIMVENINNSVTNSEWSQLVLMIQNMSLNVNSIKSEVKSEVNSIKSEVKSEVNLLKSEVQQNNIQMVEKLTIHMSQCEVDKRETMIQMNNIATGINHITTNVINLEEQLQRFSIELETLEQRFQIKDTSIEENFKKINGEIQRMQATNKNLEEDLDLQKVKLREDVETNNRFTSEVRFMMTIQNQKTEQKLQKVNEEITKLSMENSKGLGFSQNNGQLDSLNSKIENINKEMLVMQNSLEGIRKTRDTKKQKVDYDSSGSDIESTLPRGIERTEEQTLFTFSNRDYQSLHNSNQHIGPRRTIGRAHSPNTEDSYPYRERTDFQRREDYRLARFIKKDNTPTFNGYNMTAPQFINDIETFFKTIDIRDDAVKVKAISQFLKDNPLEWWKLTSKDTFTWTGFKEKFLLQFFGDYEIQRLENEWNRIYCKRHYDVERFVLRALRLQSTLKGNTDINKQCHKIIQKLPESLRDFLALRTYQTGTEFLKTVKEAMQIKNYAYMSNQRPRQRDNYRYNKYNNSDNYDQSDNQSRYDSYKSKARKSYQDRKRPWDYSSRDNSYDRYNRDNNNDRYDRNRTDNRDNYKDRRNDRDSRYNRNRDSRDNRNENNRDTRDSDNSYNRSNRDDRNYRYDRTRYSDRDTRRQSSRERSSRNNSSDRRLSRRTSNTEKNKQDTYPQDKKRARDKSVAAVVHSGHTTDGQQSGDEVQLND